MRRKNFTSPSKPSPGKRGRPGYYERHWPRSGDRDEPGFRSRRLADSRQARKGRYTTAWILGGGVILAVLIFLGVFFVMRNRGPDSGELSELPDGLGSGNVIMLARDGSGRLSQLLVLTREDPGAYNLYLIPARTVADVPGQGFQQLGDAYETGGQQALDQAVADLLQLPIQYHIFFTNQTIEWVTEQTGTVNFKTSTPLTLKAASGGTGPVTIPAGENPTGSSMALIMYNAAALDNGDGPRVLAVFFQGLHDALAAKPGLDRKAFARQLLRRVETDMDEGKFVEMFVEATEPGQGFGVWPLPVKAVTQNSGWYFEPVTGELEVLMAGSSQDSVFKLEVQNGTEASGVAESVTASLQPLRYSITVKPEPSGVNFDVTQIRCGTEALAAGNRIRDLLGRGAIIKDEYLEKKQIIVIIGRDLSAAPAGSAGQAQAD